MKFILFLLFLFAVCASKKIGHLYQVNDIEPSHFRSTRQVVQIINPRIFGLDLLGWGIDLRLGKPEEALKAPLYHWTFTNPDPTVNEYIYPLEPNTTFKVPDDVYVRTVSEMLATAKYFTTINDYLSHLSLQLGLSLSKNTSSGGSLSANSTGSASNPSLGAFAGDVDVTYNSNYLSDNRHLLVINSLESALWQIVLGPSLEYSPMPSIQNAINSAISNSTTDTLAYPKFIEFYGTHIIESVIVGGLLEMSSLTVQQNDTTNDKLAIMANFGFQQQFGLDQGNLNVTAEFSSQVTSFQQNVTNQMRALGGDPDLANFFSGNINASETFQTWQNTLIGNPAVIRYRLREISWLFPGSARVDVSSWIQRLLGGENPFNDTNST